MDQGEPIGYRIVGGRSRAVGSRAAQCWEIVVVLMAVYVVIALIGVLASWGVGEVVEQFSDIASMPVFLLLFFGNFWVSWRIALWLTEPKKPATT
jgi:hypothetical protein